jgi:hypothetical protein
VHTCWQLSCVAKLFMLAVSVLCAIRHSMFREIYEEEQILMWILKCNKNDYLNELNVCFMTFMAVVVVEAAG